MKNLAISALVASGLFAGLFGAAGVAQAAPAAIGIPALSGAVGAATDTADTTGAASALTTRDEVLPDGSINRNGGRLDSNDVLAPSRMPLITNGGGNSVWHGQNRFGYGYGSNYNYLLWD